MLFRSLRQLVRHLRIGRLQVVDPLDPHTLPARSENRAAEPVADVRRQYPGPGLHRRSDPGIVFDHRNTVIDAWAVEEREVPGGDDAVPDPVVDDGGAGANGVARLSGSRHRSRRVV
jgi:hypothetical protein